MCHVSLIWTTFGEKADLNQYFACDYELKNCFDLKGRKYFNNQKKRPTHLGGLHPIY